MDETTLKYLALGGGGLLLLFFLIGGKRRFGSDVEATLESMRISSATNIAYAQAGLENARVQADLSAQKDRNRTTIQIAGIENETLRYDVKRKADTDVSAINAGRAMFAQQLHHELGMSFRAERMQDAQFRQERKLDSRRGEREVLIEKLRANAAARAAQFGVAIEVGRQELEREYLKDSFIQNLIQQVPGLVDSFGRGLSNVSRAFGWGRPEYINSNAATYSVLPRGNSGYPAGVTVGTAPYIQSPPFYAMPEDEGPSGQQIGANVAAGAMTGAAVGGPYGAAAGAAVGAGSSFS